MQEEQTCEAVGRNGGGGGGGVGWMGEMDDRKNAWMERLMN